MSTPVQVSGIGTASALLPVVLADIEATNYPDKGSLATLISDTLKSLPVGQAVQVNVYVDDGLLQVNVRKIGTFVS